MRKQPGYIKIWRLFIPNLHIFTDLCVCVCHGYLSVFGLLTHNLLLIRAFVCSFMCVFLHVRMQHSSRGNLRMCDLRDAGFRSFCGLKGAEVSEFQFSPNGHSQPYTLTLSGSLILPTHSAAFVLGPVRLWFLLVFGCKISQGSELCKTKILSPPHSFYPFPVFELITHPSLLTLSF